MKTKMNPIHHEAAKQSPLVKKAKWRLYASHIGNYMKRWIFKHPWGTIRLHKICRSDAGRDFHDHPFSFFSILLWGRYAEITPRAWEGTLRPWTEMIPRGEKVEVIRWFNFKRAEACHRLVLEKPVWTLVFTGPYRRDWGFYTPDGWVHYSDYNGEA